ncbi:MAG: peptidylprolyl isomerase [Holophaga sp.]
MPSFAFIPVLLITTLALPLAAQSKPISKPKPKPVATAPAPVPAPIPEPTPAPKPKPRVQLNTSYGPIVLELEPDVAPATVANFLRYVTEGHYVDTIFHRVIPGFMVQGGGMTVEMMEKNTHAPVTNEAPATFKAGLKNVPGTVAMARTQDPHSASAQFFINTGNNTSLDHTAPTEEGYGYCVFGRVVEGMEAVLKIEKVTTVWRRGMQNVPEYPVRIKSAEILK